MTRGQFMDTQRQNFWKESIEKEAQVRLTWQVKYSKEFAARAFKPIPRKEGMVIKTASPLEKQMTPAKPKTATPMTRGAPPAEESSTKVITLTEMRPASQDAKKILYKGFSRIGEGRYAYLEKRKLKKPEEKYEFPIISSWEYGWQLESKNTKAAPFARSKIVRDTFFRKNGILPDPDC